MSVRSPNLSSTRRATASANTCGPQLGVRDAACSRPAHAGEAVSSGKPQGESGKRARACARERSFVLQNVHRKRRPQEHSRLWPESFKSLQDRDSAEPGPPSGPLTPQPSPRMRTLRHRPASPGHLPCTLHPSAPGSPSPTPRPQSDLPAGGVAISSRAGRAGNTTSSVTDIREGKGRQEDPRGSAPLPWLGHCPGTGAKQPARALINSGPRAPDGTHGRALRGPAARPAAQHTHQAGCMHALVPTAYNLSRIQEFGKRCLTGGVCEELRPPSLTLGGSIKQLDPGSPACPLAKHSQMDRNIAHPERQLILTKRKVSRTSSSCCCPCQYQGAPRRPRSSQRQGHGWKTWAAGLPASLHGVTATLGLRATWQGRRQR